MEISLAHIREAQLQYIHYIPVQVLVIPTWFIMSPLYTHDIIITTHKLRKFLMNPYFGRVNMHFVAQFQPLRFAAEVPKK